MSLTGLSGEGMWCLGGLAPNKLCLTRSARKDIRSPTLRIRFAYSRTFTASYRIRYVLDRKGVEREAQPYERQCEHIVGSMTPNPKRDAATKVENRLSDSADNRPRLGGSPLGVVNQTIAST